MLGAKGIATRTLGQVSPASISSSCSWSHGQCSVAKAQKSLHRYGPMSRGPLVKQNKNWNEGEESARNFGLSEIDSWGKDLEMFSLERISRYSISVLSTEYPSQKLLYCTKGKERPAKQTCLP